MKKILALAAAAAGLAWAIGRSKTPQKSSHSADPWAQATDPV